MSFASEPGNGQGAKDKGQKIVAEAGAEKGTLLVRWPTDKPWKVAAPRAALYAGEPLLALPGFVAVVSARKANPTVKVDLIGNLPELYKGQTLETLVKLNDAKDVDLDLSLERGRIIVSHVGKKGSAARCSVRFGNVSWILNLQEPGTKVLVSLKAHRLLWTPFPKKPDPKLKPALEVNLLVLAGTVDLAEAAVRQTLGPLSAVQWTSETGTGAVTLLKELPAGAKRSTDINAKKALAAISELQTRLVKGSLSEGLTAALKDKEAAVRIAAVYGLGAVGDTDAVLKALGDAKQPETRLAAVNELRHWVGQSYEHDQRLYENLLLQKYSKPHAEIVVRLLHDFKPRQLAQPETYEALIHYLTHDRLAIRQLAAWHLHQLVPDADKIVYDSAGTVEQRREGQARWRKRIPEGKIPTPPAK
jgi:hypothetical protein